MVARDVGLVKRGGGEAGGRVRRRIRRRRGRINKREKKGW